VERFEVVRVGTAADMAAALSVRRRVFIEEQRVPEDIEIDEHDVLREPLRRAQDGAQDERLISCLHVLGRLDGAAVATGRLLLAADEAGRAHIGRVAVLRELRGRGYGRDVMLALQELARERGFSGVTLAAQLPAIGFYERLGYVARGDVFLDAGIEHRWMDLDL
jgi:predicted GNAT family N-acyltransferase